MAAISRKTQWAIDRVSGNSIPSKYDWLVLQRLVASSVRCVIELPEFEKLVRIGWGLECKEDAAHMIAAATAFVEGGDRHLILSCAAIARAWSRGLKVKRYSQVEDYSLKFSTPPAR